MACFQLYDDVPGIQMDDCLSSGPYWTSIDPYLEEIHSQCDYNTAHTWNIQQRLMSYQQSVDGYGRLSPLQIPDEKLAHIGLQSPWDSRPDIYRHMRTVSPGCALGGNSATDSSASEEACSPDATRQYPRVPSMHSNHGTFYSEGSFGPGSGNSNDTWLSAPATATLYSNAPPSSPYSPSEHSACNLKDLQYLHDDEIEVEEERPSAAATNHPFLEPEEVAFEDEGVGRSIGDEESMKMEDSDVDEQDEDIDSDYMPHKRKTSSPSTTRGGCGSPRRTRSLQSTSNTSPILSSANSRVSKPAHQRNSSITNFNTTTSASKSNTAANAKASKAKAKAFPCTFSHYGCPAVFASKNEWKRHVASQHLQLGFYRCDAGFCNPDNAPAGGKNGRGYNDFNRKDLFTQHWRRMHLPFGGKWENASKQQREGFEKSMEGVRENCWVQQRERPQESRCGVPGCGRVFTGENAWEEGMEHLGRHFEKGEGVEEGVGEDEGLTAWTVREGLVKDLGTRGRWLVGMAPEELGGGTQRMSRRGRRAGGAVKEDDADEEL